MLGAIITELAGVICIAAGLHRLDAWGPVAVILLFGGIALVIAGIAQITCEGGRDG